MSKRYFINWSAWIGLFSGIYVFLYCNSPLLAYGVMPATFVALPIYFLSGAKKEEFIPFASSAVLAVLWGWLYLYCSGVLAGMGLPNPVVQFIVVGIVTFIVCAFHFTATTGIVFSKVPMMFGAIASSFLTDVGSNPEKIVPLMLTLVLGCVLALVCNAGTYFLTEDGHWSFGKKEQQA